MMKRVLSLALCAALVLHFSYAGTAALTRVSAASAGPVVTVQPTDVTAVVNSKAVFTVTAEGEGLSYQWQQLKTDEGSTWVTISSFEGCTTDTLYAPAYDVREGFQYRCIVTDQYGVKTFSDAAVLHIAAGASITQQPQAVTATANQQVSFSVKAAGEGLTYQWQAYTAQAWVNITDLDGWNTDTLSFAVKPQYKGYGFRCVVTDAYGNVAKSKDAALTIVNGVPIVQQPTDVSAVVNSTAVFTVLAEGEELTYEWQQLKTAEGSDWVTIGSFEGCKTDTLYAPAYDVRDGFRYRCIVRDTYGNKTTTEAATLHVAAGASVTQQPQAVTATVNQSVSFSVKATGVGLTYQWQAYTANGWSNVTDLNGWNTDTLSFAVKPQYKGYGFRCVVTDAYGNTAKSKDAALTIVNGVPIVQQPTDVSAVVNSTAVFTVLAEGEELTYEWQQLKTAEGSDWVTIGSFEGCKTDTLYAPAYDVRDGFQYRCIVRDTYGNKTVTDAATLHVVSGASITQQPQAVTATANQTVSFSVKAAGVGLTYQWQVYTANGWVNITDLGGCKTDTMTFAVKPQYRNNAYRCVVTDAYGNTAKSNDAQLSLVNGVPITRQPTDQQATVNGSAVFTVAADSDGLTYEWQQLKTDAGSDWVTISSYDGCKTAAMTVTAYAVRNGFQYRCVVKDQYGNRTVSDAATLYVGEGMRITGQPEGVTATTGEEASFTVGAVGEGLEYRWQVYGGQSWVDVSPDVFDSVWGEDSATVGFIVRPQYYNYDFRCIVTDAYGNTATTSSAHLTIVNGVVITKQPTHQQTPLNGSAVFTVAAQGEGLTYEWQQLKSDEGSDWVSISSYDGYKTAAMTVTAYAVRDGWQYRCIVRDQYGNRTVSDAATLHVGQGVTITSQPQAVTASPNEEVSFAVGAAGEQLTYRWQLYRGQSWVDVTDSLIEGVNGVNADTMTFNVSPKYYNYDFRCVVSDPYGNTASTEVVRLTVENGVVIADQPTDQFAAVNGTATFRVFAFGEDLTYEWQQLKTDEGSDWVTISSYEGCKTDTVTVPAYQGRSGYRYRCIVKDPYGSRAVSNEAELTVTEGVTIVTDTADVTAELYGTATYHVEADGEGLNYQWQVYDAALDLWVPISENYVQDCAGKNTDTLTFRAEPRLEQALPVRCMVSDAYGNVARSTPSFLNISLGQNNTITAEEFGADGYDGEDDRAGIQRALNFARDHATAEKPVTVTISGGVFDIKESIILYSHTRLVLSDDTTMNYTDDEGCIMQGGDGTQAGYDTLTDVKVKGGVWRGNASVNGSHTEPIGIKSASNLVFEDMTMEDSSDHFIMLTGVNGAVVRNCTFRQYYKISDEYQYTKEALHIDFLPLPDGTLFPSKNVTVENCHFDSVASGVGTHNFGYGEFETGITVRNCDFSGLLYNCVNACSMRGIEISGCTASQCGAFLWTCAATGSVHDNVIHSTGPRCISLLEGSSMEIFSNSLFSVGTIAVIGGEEIAVGPTDTGSGMGILVRDSVGVIEQNTIESVDGMGIRVRNGKSMTKVNANTVVGTSGPGIFVSNDTISVTGNFLQSTQGILAEYADSVISGNTVENSVGNGIASYCGSAEIYDNTVSSSEIYGIQLTGESASKGSANIYRNQIETSGTADIRVGTNCTDTTVAENNTGAPITLSISPWSDVNVHDNGNNSLPAAPSVNCAVTGSSVTLSWNAVQNAAYYRVYSYDAATDTLKGVARISDTSYTVTGLTADTQYAYLVLSFDEQDNCCVYTLSSNLVYVNTGSDKDDIAIVNQPKDVTVQAGSEVSFSVKALGSGLSYQWYYRKAGVQAWSKWNGHNTAVTYATANATWNGMQVYCIITDSEGDTLRSDVATIAIKDQTQIVKQSGDVTVQAGGIVTFSLEAKGEGLTYQWYYRKAGVQVWSKWNNHDTATTTAVANASWDGMQVYCVVTDGDGTKVSSEPVTIHIDKTLAITAHPSDVTVIPGQQASFTVAAVGEGLKYQWYYKKAGASAWSIWKGHTTATTSGTANDSWDGMQVYCVVSVTAGDRVESRPATIHVEQAAAVVTQPRNVSLYAGDTASFTVEAKGVGLTYQWYYRKAGVSAWSKWNGHTTATTTAIANASWNGMQVYCMVKDKNGNAVQSDAATITVLSEKFAIVSQPRNVSLNVGDTASFTVGAVGEGLGYQWYYRKAGVQAWSKWNGHTAATTSAVANASWNGMQVYCVVTDSSGSKLSSEPATISVGQELAIVSQPANVSVKAGDTAKFTVGATGAGLSYQWYYRKAGVSAWSIWKGHTTATTSAAANASWDGMQVYCVVTDSSGAAIASGTATISLI